jgi:hypothetical protein
LPDPGVDSVVDSVGDLLPAVVEHQVMALDPAQRVNVVTAHGLLSRGLLRLWQGDLPAAGPTWPGS